MERTRKLLILFFAIILLSAVPRSSLAEDNLSLPVIILGIRTEDQVTPVIRRILSEAGDMANPTPLSVGFVLRPEDVIDMPGIGQLVIGCGDGSTITVDSNQERSVSACGDYVTDEEVSVFSWRGFEVREIPRSSAKPEITYPGNSVVAERPTQVEWYFNSTDVIGDINFAVTIQFNNIDAAIPIPLIVSSEDRVETHSVDLSWNNVPDSDKYQIAVSADVTRELSNGLVRQNQVVNIATFCVREQSEEWTSIAYDTPDWVNRDDTFTFGQAVVLFENGYYSNALKLLKSLNPPILPETYTGTEDLSELVDHQSLTTSPTYYVLLGDVYNNMGILSLAMKSYDIATEFTNILGDQFTNATILLRRAEILNTSGDDQANDSATQLYNDVTDIFDSLGYPDQSQIVTNTTENSRPSHDYCDE